MTRWLVRLALALLAIGVALAALPLRASSGHWAMTSWILDFTKRWNVTVQASLIDTPPLNDPALVQLGAWQYATTCQPCHGADDRPMPVVPARMTPHPPDLRAQVARWRPRELFFIVQHGIKFTGMPAWPAEHRPDEVWPVVAFLRELPERNVTTTMADEPGAPAAWTRLVCARCHGPRGTGHANARVPALAQQPSRYLEHSLAAYADGRRQSGVMRPLAVALRPDEAREVVAWITGADAATPAGALTDRRGIAEDGVPARDIPACASCHPEPGTDRSSVYPVLRGLPATYLSTQLSLWAEGRRGGTETAAIMQAIGQRLSEEERAEAVDYYAGGRSRP
ncbi:MAG: c-type cytochrome [Acidobacteria bacterium]|nr:c-type cytochrome [Acidobacteriota bacterium]